MPTFLQEFASSVNGKREELRRKIFEGERNLLHDDFQQHFQRLWKPLDELSEFSLSPHDLDITAVDSSVYTNLLSTGGVFYIIRSLAVCKNKTQKRLETDVLYTKEGLNRILKTLGTEHIWTVKLTVTGKLRDGNFFEATAVIRTICNSKHRLFLLRTLNNS